MVRIAVKATRGLRDGTILQKSYGSPAHHQGGVTLGQELSCPPPQRLIHGRQSRELIGQKPARCGRRAHHDRTGPLA